MILDDEKQRSFFLELFNQVNFPGKYLDFAYEMKQAVVTATVKEVLPAESEAE